MAQLAYGSASLGSLESELPVELDHFKKFSDEKKDSFSKYFTLVNIIAAVTTGLLIIGSSVISTTQLYTNNFIATDSTSGLSITVSNEYGEANTAKYPYAFLSSSLFAETHKSNQFTINNVISTCSYEYTLTGITDETYSATGSIIDGVFTFEPTSNGQYALNVNEICGGSISNTLSTTVWSKYVRRELTALTDADREDFLDAFATLWKVSTVDGQKLYGSNYKSLHYFAVVHNDAGGSPACDEFHGDVGFLSNHVMIGAHLEQSLRLINPKLSLHYMEYYKYYSFGNYDTHYYNQLDGGAWTEVMTSKYFGSNDPDTGRIIDGRWADLQMPTVTDDFLVSHGIDTETTTFPDEDQPWYECLDTAHISSPYGLLRAPWNYNPSSYVTRYNNVNGVVDLSAVNTDILQYYHGVNCHDYHKFIKKIKGKTVNDFLSKVEDGSHGNLHFTIAGAGGDISNDVNTYLRETYSFDDNDIVVLARAGQKFFKYQLTEALIFKDPIKKHQQDSLPIICSNQPWDDLTQTLQPLSQPGESNGPSCVLNPELVTGDDSVNAVIDTLFGDWTNTDPEYVTKQKFLDMEYDSRVDALQTYLSRFQYEGDMASSAAALDPLFWVAHGSIERLYQKLMFANYLSDSTYTSIGPDGCSGHAADGTKAWLKGFSFNDADIDATAITNEDFVEHLKPDSDFYRDNFDSIYDHSDWDTVCSDDDINLFD